MNQKIGKIVGLDPAGPLFTLQEAESRLADTDAQYVETIQTCSGTLGFTAPLGNASFYPNWGKSQPGCGLDMTGVCAHNRANEFYIESINTPQFFAVQCDSFETLQTKNCSFASEVHQMGGEPGNRA